MKKACASAAASATPHDQDEMATELAACCIFICGGIVGIYHLFLSEDPQEPCSTFDEDESTCTAAARGCKVITHTLNGSHPIYKSCLPSEVTDLTAWRGHECNGCNPDWLGVMEGDPESIADASANGDSCR